ncbi:MAG: IclR family transcriptional regulator [Pseudomonadota bacterium]
MARRGKPATASAEERRGIQSVEVSAVILSALTTAGSAVSLKELSDIAEMPPSKTHRYLSSFIRTGLVRQDEQSGHYDLGPAALELGLAALSRLDVLELAQHEMKLIAKETDLTTLLSVWGQNGPTVVRWQRARTQLVTSLGLGSVLPVTFSATGHVFLSYLPQAMTANLVSKELKASKKNTSEKNRAKTKKEVYNIIDKVRKLGHASADSSVIPGLQALAAPILDHQGEASAVITLIGPDDFIHNQNHHAATTLKAACGRLSFRPEYEQASL